MIFQNKRGILIPLKKNQLDSIHYILTNACIEHIYNKRDLVILKDGKDITEPLLAIYSGQEERLDNAMIRVIKLKEHKGTAINIRSFVECFFEVAISFIVLLIGIALLVNAIMRIGE